MALVLITGIFTQLLNLLYFIVFVVFPARSWLILYLKFLIAILARDNIYIKTV